MIVTQSSKEEQQHYHLQFDKIEFNTANVYRAI